MHGTAARASEHEVRAASRRRANLFFFAEFKFSFVIYNNHTMAALDKYIYDEALDFDPDNVAHCIKKDQLQIYDTNGNSYGSQQVIFSTDQVANSGYMLDYANAYMTVPFQITAKSGDPEVDFTNTMNSYVLGLKSGTHHLVDNVQIDFSGTTIQNQTNFQNIYANYKILTSQSLNKIQKSGMSSLVSPDSPSFSYSPDAVGNNGNGISNNRPFATYPLVAETKVANYARTTNQNTGYLQRLLYACNPATGIRGLPGRTQALAQAAALPYFDGAGADEERVFVWSMMAIIKLADISDFIKNLPIHRGSVMRIILNFNSVVSQTITIDNTSTSGVTPAFSTLTTSSTVTTLRGNTNPIMMSSGDHGQPSSYLTSGPLILSAGIGNSATNYQSSLLSGYSNCRIMVMGYTLNPSYESQLREKREKKIVYEDILSYTFNAAAGPNAGQVSQLLFNSVTNPKWVLIAPFLSASEEDGNGDMGLVEYQSPFSSAPSTCFPGASLTNFQIQVSGQNMFMSAELYDFQQFLDEFRSINALYGDGDDRMTSGVIDINNWSNAYRYYVCDVSRRLPPDDKASKNIQVLFTNNTAVSLQLVCFVAYQKELTIDMFTGLITHSRL